LTTAGFPLYHIFFFVEAVVKPKGEIDSPRKCKPADTGAL
jgi:hypothetical protein